MKIKQLLQIVWFKITGKQSNEKLGFTCCFCNTSIMALDKYPTDLNITVNIDKPKDQQADQFFYCHLLCLKNKLHPSIKKLSALDDINE